MSPFRQAWRAITSRFIRIEPEEVWELIGSRSDPFRAHYSVSIVRTSTDGNWVEFRYKYGTVSSLRRDIFVSTYVKRVSND